jgi:hypothetical protein
MRKDQYRRENLYKIIVAYDRGAGVTGFAKFRNIEVDKPASWRRTENFLTRTFPTIQHVNVYGGITGEFKKQIKYGR